MAIEHKFLKNPSDIIYAALLFMKKWTIFLKDEDHLGIKQLKKDIMRWMGNFKPTMLISTDVVEI